MTAPPSTVPAVAVRAGTSATRVAAAGPDGRPELVAQLPAGTPVGSALASLYGDAPVPLVLLVHPPGWAPDEVASAVEALRGRAAAVRPVPAPLAVLAGLGDTAAAVPSGAGRGACLVVDAGASGTDLTVVAGDRAMPAHRVDVGGDRLDAALGAAVGLAPALARPVREALSLRTDVVLPGGLRCDASRCRRVIRPVLAELSAAVAVTVRRSRAVTVVLTGGLARTPLLAELLDDALDVPVHLLDAPESAAVLGALRTAGRPDTVAGRTDDLTPARGGPGPAAGRRGHRSVAPLVAALGIALVATGAVAARAPAAPGPPQGTALVQYGYTTVLPAGWEHTGGLPERRRTLLTRTGSPDGAELIAVERAPLGYDSALEPERARAELDAEFGRRAVRAGLHDLREDTVDGRAVLRYRQAGPGPAVDWFVLFTGTDELVVGCRYPDAPAVARACAAVVASVRPVD